MSETSIQETMSLSDLLEQFTGFVNEAHRLKALYAPSINLLVGLETEYITSLDLQRLEHTLATFGNQLEFLVGSVHHVNGIPIDFDGPTYERAIASCSVDNDGDPQAAFLSAYFEAQYELIQRFKPEIIGHFDLCRLFRPSLRFNDYPSIWQKIQRNIRFAVDYGALFEINAAAFRKNWDTAYPGKDIIEVCNIHVAKKNCSMDSTGF
jgi:histidinol-phosphatase (PHP family)